MTSKAIKMLGTTGYKILAKEGKLWVKRLILQIIIIIILSSLVVEVVTVVVVVVTVGAATSKPVAISTGIR